ncbi:MULTISPECIES: DoxX family protein [Bacillaceae]|uniref:DoxX family protein n=1 Tax=Bacillaceae TaxID=186817 RepID=UPI002FFFC73D
MRWYKTPIAAVVWTVLRIWLGFQWIEAGYHKLVGGFDAGGFLKGALANATGEHPAVQAWYADFLQSFAIPNVHIFNVLIPWGELLVGIGLVVGLATIPALIAGAFMNLNFMLAGTTSTNPILYTAAMILLFAGAGAYYFGLDRFAVPYVKNVLKKEPVKNGNTH